jgi:hypothetical protein
MKLTMCLIAFGVFVASPAVADNAFVKKPPPAQSVRTAQGDSCSRRGVECCCERAGPLCCEGLHCVIKGNHGTCQPN